MGRYLLGVLLAFVALGAHGSVHAQTAHAPSPKPWLGVVYEPGAAGLRISEVIPDSPADMAGIQIGDVVRAVSGHPTLLPNMLYATIQKFSVGDEVVVSLRRNGRPLDVRAELSNFLSPADLLRRRLVDQRAPEFFLKAAYGKSSGELAAFRDKVVVIEFWSSSCSLCQRTIEDLANLQADARDDVVVLAITSDSEAQIRRFTEKFSMPIPILRDPQRIVHTAYHYENLIPTVVVIGRDGQVRYADTGSSLNMANVLLFAKRAVRELSN